MQTMQKMLLIALLCKHTHVPHYINTWSINTFDKYHLEKNIAVTACRLMKDNSKYMEKIKVFELAEENSKH